MFKVISKDTGEVKEVVHVKEDENWQIWFLIFDGAYWTYQQSINYVPKKY